MDDGASVAESFMSLGKVRRTEAERLEYFKNQPECDDIEPHRVKCLRCQKHVNLGRQRSYTVRPWEQHRARCDQNVPKSMLYVFAASKHSLLMRVSLSVTITSNLAPKAKKGPTLGRPLPHRCTQPPSGNPPRSVKQY